MKNKKYAVLAALLLAVMFMAPISASAAQGGVLSVPVVGQALNPVTNITTPITGGTLNVTGFAVQNGKLVATGTLNFLLNNVQQVVQVALPVTQATGACPILTLSIGAIHLRPPRVCL